MIIIHEGVDGSGKSYNSGRFAYGLGEKYVHNPVDWNSKDPYQDWCKFMEEHSHVEDVIHVDRSFLSNKPYRKWHGTPEDFTKEQLDKLCRYDFDLCYYESDTEYEDASARGEDNLKTKDDYDQIKKYYREMIKNLHEKYNLTVWMFNWRKDRQPRKVINFDTFECEPDKHSSLFLP